MPKHTPCTTTIHTPTPPPPLPLGLMVASTKNLSQDDEPAPQEAAMYPHWSMHQAAVTSHLFKDDLCDAKSTEEATVVQMPLGR